MQYQCAIVPRCIYELFILDKIGKTGALVQHWFTQKKISGLSHNPLLQ